MAKIIHLGGDRHKETQEALPWYVMERLDVHERAEVEAHLVDCAACRRDLEAERELATQVAGLPLDADASWMAMRRRMREEPGGLRAALQRLFMRPTRLGWVIAGQALALAAVVLAFTMPAQRTAPEYHALSAPVAYAPGNVIAIFRPDISEQRFRGTLVDSQARLVDGPTAAGAYVLRVPEGQRTAILVRLRQNADVVLAQPIDPAPTR